MNTPPKGHEFMLNDIDNPPPAMKAPARTEFRGFKVAGHNIRKVVWFPEAPLGTLAVEFSGGATYTYAGVPVEVYLALRDAPSVGGTFDAIVKKAGYAFQRVTG